MERWFYGGRELPDGRQLGGQRPEQINHALRPSADVPAVVDEKRLMRQERRPAATIILSEMWRPRDAGARATIASHKIVRLPR